MDDIYGAPIDIGLSGLVTLWFAPERSGKGGRLFAELSGKEILSMHLDESDLSRLTRILSDQLSGDL